MKTEQVIRIMKDGKVLETLTITRELEHTGAAIAMYKLAIDESMYTKSEYDVITSNETIDHGFINNREHRNRELMRQGKDNSTL